MSTRLLLAGVWAIGLFSSGARAQCVSGTVQAVQEASGQYVGLYKYTMQVTWDMPQGLSHLTLDFGLEFCAEACDQEWFFDEPAGTGVGGNCDFGLTGEFNCNGDPSIGIDYPVLKWDVIDTEGCDVGFAGTATVSFYSPLPPVSDDAAVVFVKNGRPVCQGVISGDYPAACAPTAVEASSVGSVKALYR